MSSFIDLPTLSSGECGKFCKSFVSGSLKLHILIEIINLSWYTKDASLRDGMSARAEEDPYPLSLSAEELADIPNLRFAPKLPKGLPACRELEDPMDLVGSCQAGDQLTRPC